MTYAEYLQSLGASADDIKVMDTAIGRRAFEKLQADAATALAAAKTEKDKAEAYEARVDEWFKTHDAEFKGVESKLIAAESRGAAAIAALRTAHERGLIDVAKDLGFKLDEPAAPVKKDEPVAIDTSKFMTTDAVLQLAEREAESIAMMSDIAAEHVYLFGSPLRNARELRKEATTRKISLEQVWMEEYKVPEARVAKEAAAKKADEDALRKKITEEVSAELAAKYGNPELRPLEPSRSFLIPRKDAGREKQPWEAGFDGEGGSNDRVRRATENALRRQVTH